ncbi:DUF6132 family protein [Bacteroidota bacterium]
MRNFITKHRLGLLLVIPGIIAGFLYWKYVGCTSGTCPITSNWHSTVLFGGLIGFFAGDSIDDIQKKRKENNTEKN